MRLDIFLPFLKKPKKNAPPRAEAWGTQLARRVLPASWLSETTTAKPGLLRRTLKWLGPTWHAAPWRRIAQGACFVLFFWLFLYTCWPYHARPARDWKGWRLADARAEQLAVERNDLPSDLPAGTAVYLAGDDLAEISQTPLLVAGTKDKQLLLRPREPLASGLVESLQFVTGAVATVQERPSGAWPDHYTRSLEAKEFIHAESLLVIDPLVALSTAVAGRAWVWSLVCAGGILLAAVLVPRGFCGYICPLGTLIDLFDWAIAGRVKRFRVPDDGWWVHVKYYVLLGVMLCSLCGVLVSGFVSAIPVLTRGMLYLIEPFQTASARGWHNVAPMHWGHALSLGMFFGVLALGFMKPRFWCKYVCPSGAVFSVGNLFRLTERKVEDTCIHCNKCVEICPFDAIKADFTTRTTDCTLCQTCGGACPVHAIKFVDRFNLIQLKLENDPPTHETPLGRRGFLSLAAGSAAAAVGAGGLTLATSVWGAGLDDPNQPRPIRPPGSVPEQEFLQLCIRCGECFKACPNNVLQPLGFEQGLEGLWTPAAKPDWAGCESSCNACGQVCPTGAIRALPLEEKKVARMGLAIVNQETCLPFAQREACQLCVDDCHAAGYHAIEFTRVGAEADPLTGEPVEGSGFLAPVVLPQLCVGCGLCQTRCYGVNAADKKLLSGSAIVVLAGDGKEDRLRGGSYIALREAEAAERLRQQKEREKASGGGNYLPDFLK